MLLFNEWIAVIPRAFFHCSSSKDLPLESLTLLGISTKAISNIFDLSSTATIGSSGFLLIFAGVNFSNIILHEQTKSSPLISMLGFIACLLSFGTLAWKTDLSNPFRFLVLLLFVVFSFGIAILSHRRRIKNLNRS